MPIYEYRCPNHACGTTTEKFITHFDERPASVKCPHCGAKAGHVEFSRTGVQFGLGFSKEAYSSKSERGAYVNHPTVCEWSGKERD